MHGTIGSAHGTSRRLWYILGGVALLFAILLVVPGPWNGLVRTWSDDEVSADLREILAGTETPKQLEGVTLDRRALAGFYSARNHAPLWLGETGPGGAARALLKELKAADEEGLNPADYNVRAIEKAMNAPVAAGARGAAALELLLSQSLARYAVHLRQGRIPRAMIYTEDSMEPERMTVRSVLEDAGGASDLEDYIDDLDELNPIYAGLREALARTRADRKAAAAARTIPAGEPLKPGARDPRVVQLRARMAVPAPAGAADLYDPRLAAAVKAFQKSKGLKGDGVVGEGTLAFLNARPADVTGTIIANMERARWLPAKFPDRHILVDTAGFNLRMVDGGKEVDRMRVVVGEAEQPTPMMADKMQYVEVNPYWNVPNSILREEIAPKVLAQGSGYLAARDMEVVSGYGDDAFAISADEVDWSAVAAGATDVRVRQRPGRQNALGHVKFMFPNEYDIYLHDTPADTLFGAGLPAYSHGCVRVERPGDLAMWVLKDKGWTAQTLRDTVATGENRQVDLDEDIPVYITYFTAWPRGDGTVEFRPDIYERDRPLIARLTA